MATAVATPTTNGSDRRKSGRTSHRPLNFSQEIYEGSVLNSSKRKRPSAATNVQDEDEDEDEVEGEGVEDESQDDDAEDEPDEEELRERRRKQRARNAVARPAAKRARTANGVSTTLAIRSANATSKNVSKQARQKARSRPSQFQATGLYAEVFGKGLDAETAATNWQNEMENDNVAGLKDIINFILQCIGCESRIESSDIDDVDNISGKLGDILNEYGNQKEGDYPLSSKQKQFHGMKDVLVEFFKAVIHGLHNSNLMYDEPAIYDNIHIWTATMASAGFRSFRHTATVISLAMTTALTEVAKELQSSMATTKQQLDSEKKKKSANKGRISKLQEEMARDEKKLEVIDNQLRDAFDTVYIHRYRDVEEKIRVECVAAIGSWILNYRKMFLEGQYLRYIGWVMSDPYALTRLEVIRQLKALFKQKQNVPALRAFTERFRSRIVEMGARDADTTVRAETIELLDRLRNAELLEPDDIETIGQLVFDNEPKVRKAVAKFFVSNIEDLYSASVDEFDQEQFNEALPDEDETEDFDTPNKLWIKFKCLAQTLGAQQNTISRSSNKRSDTFGTEADSRYMVATQAIFNAMPELHHWEALAGYLLHDHSNITRAKNTSGLSAAVQEAYKLENGEDLILLDVLYCAAKLSLQEPVDDAKTNRTKKAKDEARQRQETAAHNLSVMIPQLHNKFGSTPQAAKVILRLHQLFDADLVDDVHDEEADHTALLDDVNKQFTAHSDADVLAEASRALRAALHHESSKEAADAKVLELWQESSQSLAALLSGKNVSGRGTLDTNALRQVVDVVARFAHLASITDCCEVLEGRMTWPKSKANQGRKESLLDVLLQLVKRGEPDDDTPRESAQLEDQLCRFALKTLSFYYRWKIVSLKSAISTNDKSRLSTGSLTNIAMRKTDLIEAILPIVSPRKPLDHVRITALLSLVDLYVLFATVRYMKPDGEIGGLDADVQANLNSLVTDLDSTTRTALMETHEKMEKRLASKSGKRNIDLPLGKAKRANKRKARTSSINNDVTTTNGHVAADEEEIDRPPEDSDDEAARTTQRRRRHPNQTSDSESDATSSDDDDTASALSDPLSGEDADPDATKAVRALAQREAKKKAILVAETSLCELTAKIVLAVLAGIVSEGNEVRKRLQLNRGKLGKSYSQVIAYLDDKKAAAKGGKKGQARPKTPVTKAATKKDTKAMVSEAMVLSDDDIEDASDEEERRDDDDPEALRERGLDDDGDIEEAESVAEDAAAAATAADDDDDDDDEIMGD
ncbi:cohesin complex subunit [Neophaeococcomyces mojaviensis]|uniref:Cohesin complex subunit n=1 Tax=Neophaeococcomyces mojaviensis TaxID=3383035 RepID=A0ACC3A2J5_9EURO|nr:cohesin complex subunit [Knufia sp. JES_112]